MTKYDIKKIIYLVLLALIILSALVFLFRPSWEIGSDGYGYYSYLRSYVFDQDFDFYNEYEQFDSFYGARMVQFSEIGKVKNLFSVGPALLWSPFFLVGHGLVNYHDIADPYNLPGFNTPYQASVALGTIFYFFIGLLFLYGGLKKLFNDRIAFWTSSFIWLISPLVFYTVYEPSMSHALSFFAVGGLFYFFTKFKSELKPWHFIILGIFLGLAMLVRWQNLIFITLPLALLFDKNLKIPQKLLSFLLLFVFSWTIFIPQMLMWNHLYGAFFTIPQGTSFFSLLAPNIGKFLFSGYHGLFSWHPLLLLGVIGLFVNIKNNLYLKLTLIITLLLQIYLNSGLVDWMAGGSFGARRMIGSLFIFAIGFGFLINYLKEKNTLLLILSVVIVLGIIWNILLMISTATGVLPLDAPVTIIEVFSSPIKTIPLFFK